MECVTPSIVELIDRIKSRPAMFIGQRSISCLAAFIDGWRYGLSGSVSDEQILLGFQEWVQRRFHVSTTHGWARIILFHSHDEVDALDQFFALFSEYIATVDAERG